MTSNINRHIVLARRPDGYPRNDDFKLTESALRPLRTGEFLAKNYYVSLDAGFRNWMNESSGDNVLPALPIDEPVMGLTLSKVLESNNREYSPGTTLMARFAWEEYSISSGGDFIVRLPSTLDFPSSYYMGILGDTGMTAYFGLVDIGKPAADETVLISAAGGAVGSVAGQIAKILGGRAVGISSTEEKCRRLVEELGYEAAVNRRSAAGIQAAIAEVCPDGVDVYFDSVGGETLQAALTNLAPGGRIVMCGAITHYNADEPMAGPNNMFDIVTKEITVQGFLTHHRVDRYPEARSQLEEWLDSGLLTNIEYRLQGIENVGVAFCDMFSGKNFGKTVVQLFDDGDL